MATAKEIRTAVLAAVEAGIKADSANASFRTLMFAAHLAANLAAQGEPDLAAALDRLRCPGKPQAPTDGA